MTENEHVHYVSRLCLCIILLFYGPSETTTHLVRLLRRPARIRGSLQPRRVANPCSCDNRPRRRRGVVVAHTQSRGQRVAGQESIHK